MTTQPIRVLVVDDSAFARKVIREVLSSDSMIEVVGYARDGLDALEKIEELKPDVITLDLVMPDLDGIGVLRALPKTCTSKIIVVSVSGPDSELVIEALHLGAIDVVTKPTASPTDRLYDLSAELIGKVKAANLARPRVFLEGEAKPEKVAGFSKKFQLMVLGTSTGGPQAISEIFKTLPGNFPIPLVIALHIPDGYTTPLALRISRTSELPLIEAVDGMELVAHRAYIAPGGKHLLIKKVNQRLYASITLEPVESLYHPSINILFESAVEQVGGEVIGVVLTGMGNDGTIGAQAIKKAGGRVLAESASSCVVYGMPRSVIESGASTEEAPLEKMANLMLKVLQ